jgi:S-adenosylmethionine synthetase
MFTSESVTEGHPDKLCDQISDAITGRYLRQDRLASAIAECAISTGIVFVAARISSTGTIDIPATVRNVIAASGYTADGFDVRNCTVMTSITDLPLPARRVAEDQLAEDQLDQVLANDQATVFGYACNHTPGLMPLPVWLAHRLARRISEVRREGVLSYLAPDAKTQVGIEFRDRRPLRIHSVSVVASQLHEDSITPRRLQQDIIECVVEPCLAAEPCGLDARTRLFINPAGPVVGGGPAVHSGMTGRKTAVDTYGEFSRGSSSALSGKDPSRIDRVGAYAARHAAKNVVAAGLADECEVQLSYTIGLPGPVSVQVETRGNRQISDAELKSRVDRVFDFRLASIVRRFSLRDLPQASDDGYYQKLSVFGQMGRTDLELPWERLDAVNLLRRDA